MLGKGRGFIGSLAGMLPVRQAELERQIREIVRAQVIELGHPTDTTLARASAGVLSVEGVPLLRAANCSFSAHKNGSDQAINTASITKVTFGTEAFDVGSKFASSTWTPLAGTVKLAAGLITTATLTAAELFTLHIYKNGTSFKQVAGLAASNNFGGASISIIDQTNGTDTYEVYVQSTVDIVWSVLGQTNATWFMGAMI